MLAYMPYCYPADNSNHTDILADAIPETIPQCGMVAPFNILYWTD